MEDYQDIEMSLSSSSPTMRPSIVASNVQQNKGAPKPNANTDKIKYVLKAPSRFTDIELLKEKREIADARTKHNATEIPLLRLPPEIHNQILNYIFLGAVHMPLAGDTLLPARSYDDIRYRGSKPIPGFTSKDSICKNPACVEYKFEIWDDQYNVFRDEAPSSFTKHHLQPRTPKNCPCQEPEPVFRAPVGFLATCKQVYAEGRAMFFESEFVFEIEFGHSALQIRKHRCVRWLREIKYITVYCDWGQFIRAKDPVSMGWFRPEAIPSVFPSLKRLSFVLRENVVSFRHVPKVRPEDHPLMHYLWMVAVEIPAEVDVRLKLDGVYCESVASLYSARLARREWKRIEDNLKIYVDMAKMVRKTISEHDRESGRKKCNQRIYGSNN